MIERSSSAPGRHWLELGVVAILFCVFLAFAMNAMMNMQAQSEQTTVDVNVRNMRTGLQLQLSDMMLHGRMGEIPALAGQNPVQWLAQPPQGYLGELDAAPISPPPGSWYFDRIERSLVYCSGAGRFGRYYEGDTEPRWRIMPGSGNGEGGLAGIRLARVKK